MQIGQQLAYLVVMAGVTYLIRMIPLVIFRKKITNRYIWSFLYYIPYAVLAAMTIPAAFEATSSTVSAAVGLVVAMVGALVGLGLLPVAVLSCVSVFVCEWVMRFL